ncbi:DUF805 domain-containing protein [Vibrio parahaemolyticus]|uniref:DUF805 domain-containing protein n=1 Tax=Vibrio parahaemolyticus TaxID=670 RepID=UPI0015BE7A9F|nr:DUF805 domain-containing protein [Vibrio parahaemolyticus]MBE4327783.1 DUF805 domain-containing protein [Vibrio parahaemolyticus]QLE27538.1 DUF805 domain-containing protein [Vibrio parahaemolyticus]HCE1882714.1 DUF805 domain-containing protein [Vibrio parahaemolyticus]HCE3647827.1 DUF805 domain-containing protein [Vibrio parahaemolyticus]HCE4537690.1 DUF805 domain-containing protein [Vibrio parahaemolyticus]
MDYFIGALKKYADFTGRARRKEYWMFALFYMLFYIGLVVIDLMIGTEFFSIIFSLALLIPSISIATRRLHDTGRSGWWQLIALIPLVGAIVLIVFLAQDSHDANEYGANPKAEVSV